MKACLHEVTGVLSPDQRKRWDLVSEFFSVAPVMKFSSEIPGPILEMYLLDWWDGGDRSSRPVSVFEVHARQEGLAWTCEKKLTPGQQVRTASNDEARQLRDVFVCRGSVWTRRNRGREQKNVERQRQASRIPWPWKRWTDEKGGLNSREDKRLHSRSFKFRSNFLP